MREYEVMTIHRPDLAEADVDVKVSELESYVSQGGGSVTKRDLWGKRRFAYQIDHLTEGYYSVVSFLAEPETVAVMERMLTLADEVVRHKIVRLND